MIWEKWKLGWLIVCSSFFKKSPSGYLFGVQWVLGLLISIEHLEESKNECTPSPWGAYFLEGCRQKAITRVSTFLKGKLLCKHFEEIWPGCGLRKSSFRKAYMDSEEEGDILARGGGIVCVEGRVHSVAKGNTVAHRSVKILARLSSGQGGVKEEGNWFSLAWK